MMKAKGLYLLWITAVLLVGQPLAAQQGAAGRSGLGNIIHFFTSSKADYPKKPVDPSQIRLPKDSVAGTIRTPSQDRILNYIWSSQREAGYTRFEKESDSTYLARLVWVPEDHYIDGKPPVDFRNPDKNKKNRPLLGLVYSNRVTYKDGKWYFPYLYHPNFGLTASRGEMFFNSDGDLIIRGWLMGFSATECYKIVDYTPDL